jgi:hypothetical protein
MKSILDQIEIALEDVVAAAGHVIVGNSNVEEVLSEVGEALREYERITHMYMDRTPDGDFTLQRVGPGWETDTDA